MRLRRGRSVEKARSNELRSERGEEEREEERREKRGEAWSDTSTSLLAIRPLFLALSILTDRSLLTLSLSPPCPLLFISQYCSSWSPNMCCLSPFTKFLKSPSLKSIHFDLFSWPTIILTSPSLLTLSPGSSNHMSASFPSLFSLPSPPPPLQPCPLWSIPLILFTDATLCPSIPSPKGDSFFTFQDES